MAYMCSIGTHCQMGVCRKPRTHRVYSQINEAKGDYCQRHAKERLHDLQATEDMIRARAQPEPKSPREVQDAHLATFGEGHKP